MQYDWNVSEFEFDGKWFATVISKVGTVLHTTESGDTREDARAMAFDWMKEQTEQHQ